MREKAAGKRMCGAVDMDGKPGGKPSTKIKGIESIWTQPRVPRLTLLRVTCVATQVKK